MNGYLLDTNPCSRLIEGHPEVIRRLGQCGDEPVVTNAIVRGELVFMARNSQKIQRNLNRIRAFLKGIEVLPVDDETADYYAQIKATLIEQFGPKSRTLRRRTKIRQLGF